MKYRLAGSVGILALAVVVAASASAVGSTVRAGAAACTAGAACVQGSWRVLPVSSPVRASRAVVMHDGNVLLVAGSGNDPAEFAAHTFESAVYNPNKGTFKVIRTPDDFSAPGRCSYRTGKC